jgi:hypothetical protein
MKRSSTFRRVVGFLFVFSLLSSTSALAGEPLITAAFSGIWDQPEQESQGIILQIGEQLDEQGVEKKVGIAYWFTYGPDLQTSWYLGVGPVAGHQIDLVLYTASDIGFMAANLEGDESVVPVGSMLLDFRNCNHGTATFEFVEDDQVLDSGEFPIKRISSIYRQRCSGGISDDTPADRKPLQMEVRLLPVDEVGSGEGKAKFWERADRSDFKVEVEYIPDGTYVVEICGDHEEPAVEAKLFDIEVLNGEGELEFRSPAIDEKLDLNFDPRACKIDVLDGDLVVLTTGDRVLSEDKSHGKHHDGSNGANLIEADFTNTGIIEAAKGSAEFEYEADGSELAVKIKDVPLGLYALHINGINHGDIEVVEKNKRTEGMVKLTSPLKDGTLELLEDPRGQLIEVLQNAVEGTPVILEALFPGE